MAEILIHAIDHTHDDPDTDRRGCHKKGDIANIKSDGWSAHPNWAQTQYPHSRSGLFVLVKVPGLSVEDAIAYRGPWQDAIAYEVLSANATQGTYSVRVTESNPGASGANAMSAAKIQRFLSGWGCTDITFSPNACTFTFNLWNAVRSSHFWGVPLIGSAAQFALISYSGATGIGRIQVTILDLTLRMKGVLSLIDERGGTLVTNAYPVLTFDIERADILQRFREDVKQKAERVYQRHRWAVASASVDAIIAVGGIITRTPSQMQSALIDKMVVA